MAEEIIVPVRIVSRSTSVWDSIPHQHYPVYISYHLLDEKNNLLVDDNVRTALESRPAEEATTAHLLVVAPAEPGRYLIEVDMVKERVNWFENEGLRSR